MSDDVEKDDEQDKGPAGDGIQTAVEWLKWYQQIEGHQLKREEDDLSFQDADDAWPQAIRTAMGPSDANRALGIPALPGKPIISVASLDEPLALVDAQERKAHLGVTFHPLSEDADDDTAEFLTGIYRGIERDSNAAMVRSWSYQRADRAGRGVYRVVKEYDSEGGHPLDQKLKLKRILYQGNVCIDPLAQEADASDQMRSLVLDDLRWSVYTKKYPNSRLGKYDDSELKQLSDAAGDWLKRGESDDNITVRIAEDWRVDVEYVDQVLLDDNSIADANDIPEGRTKHPTDTRYVPQREVRTVTCRIVNGIDEVLEGPWEWDGQYIPLIRVIGKELQPYKGKRQFFGLIANAKGAVRLTNVAASNAIRMAALEPRAPYTLDPKQIEGYEEWWNTSNTKDWPYLPVHDEKDGRKFDRPQRTQVDASRMGPSMQLLSMGRDFVRTATGIQAPALGENTPAHRSGRAIANLQNQSVEGTSVFLDNLATVSMPYEAKVILDLIPHVYDRPGRLCRVVDMQDKSSIAMVNRPFTRSSPNARPQALPYSTPADKFATDGMVQDPNNPAKHYDLNKGRYGVSIQVGKAKPTRLAEGSDALSLLMQSDPALVPLLGPEWAKFQDFPGHDSVEQLLTQFRNHQFPFLAPMDGQMPDPRMLMAENQHLKQILTQAAQEKQAKVVENQGKFAIAKMQEDAESQRSAADREVKLAVAELTAKTERMELFLTEVQRLGVQTHETMQQLLDQRHEAQQNALDRAHEAASSAQDHAQTVQQNTNQAMNDAVLADQANDHALAQQDNQPEEPNA